MQTVWIPTASAEIDVAWLNAVLPDDVRDGGVVTDVTSVVACGVTRLTVQYDGAGTRAVTSMIAKLPAPTDGARREHLFYEQVGDRMVVDVPIAYVNLGDAQQGRYVLLLEDMAPRRTGNPSTSCSWGDAVVALGELARLHALWWEHPELESFAEWMPGPGSDHWQTARQRFVAGLPRLREHVGHGVCDSVVALAERYAEHWDDGLRAGAFRGPLTFVHGDVRLDNMMFLDHDLGTELVLLDWQRPLRANSMCDVVHFLAGNFESAWRRRHQAELVRIYFDALVGNGVSDHSFEQCWERYRASGLVLLAEMVNLADDNELDGMFRRYAAAVDDLGSASFLA